MKSSCRYSEGSEGEGLRSLGPNIFFQVRGAGRSDIGGKLVLQCLEGLLPSGACVISLVLSRGNKNMK